MRRAHALAVAAAALVSFAAEASSSEASGAVVAPSTPPHRLAIELTAEASNNAQLPRWRVAAMAELLALEAARDRRIQRAKPGAPATLILAGQLGAERLQLSVSGGARLASAAITVKASSRLELRRALRTLLDEALRPLGEGEAGASPATIGAAGTANAGPILLSWLAMLLVLATPFAIGAWLLGLAKLRRLLATRSFRHAITIACASLVAGLAVILLGERLADLGAGVLILGGLAWGWFAVVNLRVVFPSLPGFERVEHGDVFRLSRAWSLVALQRLVRAAAFYTPFALLLWLACRVLGVSDTVALAVLAPAWGLFARFWLLALVDVASIYLDHQLVPGAATAQAPWHQAVHGYFMGYVRRAGWPATDALLDDVLFLPGVDNEVVLYGGGLTHSRIVLGTKLLEYALAPYGRPHDYAGPRISKLHWSEWNAGLVVPVTVEGTLATPQDRQPRHATVAGETDWEPLGQPPTLAGFVEPDRYDKRDAHRPHEDPLWLEWDAGDEHDGTDASDKDFVFGALVRQLGAIRRRDDEIATLGRALRRRLETGPAFARTTFDRVARWLHRSFSRYPAIIGDAYAALNYARHHLIQYLAWRAWEREDLLTARAYAPELEGQSNHILRELDGRAGTEAEADRAFGATTAKRMWWLAAFFRRPRRSPRNVLARRIAVASAVLVVAVFCALGIKRAVDYHPTYVDRLEEQRQEHQGSEHEQD